MKFTNKPINSELIEIQFYKERCVSFFFHKVKAMSSKLMVSLEKLSLLKSQ